MWVRLACVLAALTTVMVSVTEAQEQSCTVDFTEGCRLSRPPIYMVLAPRKVRPNQVVQLFVSILKVEYNHVNVRASIVKDNVEYAGTVLRFDRPSSRIMQLQMPQNAQGGKYRLRIEGTLNGGTSGNIFQNETEILFDTKQASLFIQMSKPIYKQGQMVHFRVVPIKPNMMPMYGSMTIYVDDPSGISVRRWLGMQTNAGGIVSQSFELADQPNFGTWQIRVDAFGHTYRKEFTVEEFWEPRFDVNVSVKPYIMDNEESFHVVVQANQTSGRACVGNASVTVLLKPPGWQESEMWRQQQSQYSQSGLYAQNAQFLPPGYNYPYIYRFISYTTGSIDLEFRMDEIRELARRILGYGQSLVDCELEFRANVSDWHTGQNRTGWASTIIFNSRVRLQWVGDHVRTFKPNSVLTVQVAVTNYDGTPVESVDRRVTFIPSRTAGSGLNTPKEVAPVNGIAEFSMSVGKEETSVIITAQYMNDPTTRIELRASRYYSPTDSYISVTTSTRYPKVNEYMIFHVKTSNFVPRIFYQVVASGNIIIGDELEMTSRQKTFAIALSREMMPNARMVVYYIRQPEEIVVDVLNFFVNGTRQNQVQLTINRGKDFSRDTIEFNAYADPGSYVAFAALPHDLYMRGLSDGISENKIIDELDTYDKPARASFRHLWRVSDTDYEYKFFHSPDYGIDTNTSFFDAGLLIMTDASVERVPGVELCDENLGSYPCLTANGKCYTMDQKCDGRFDCEDGGDEVNCEYNNTQVRHREAMDRISRVMRFYDDSSWAWQEIFVKPDGRVDFRVDTPKYPLTWMINGLSVSRDLGLGIMQRPIRYEAARYMYIQVECPDVIVRGEQIGVRVTIFNYWFDDDYLEVLLTMHADPSHRKVLVEEFGIVSSYNPRTHGGDFQTIVFLEPGESKDIYLPIVPAPDVVQGEMNFRVSATCFMERDEVRRTIKVIPDGVKNYFHTPYLIDLITAASMMIPDFDVPVPEQFVVPEVREHQYVPGSAIGHLSVFGDVVTPGFFENYLTAENVLHRPYGAGENVAFNFAYNLITLRFMKASQQLSDVDLKNALYSMNVAFQRILSYMDPETGAFRMFRDDPTPSLWLTAFVAQHLHKARFGEWERDLFIPIELLNKMVVWICNQQNATTGAFDPIFNETHPVYDTYDRKMTSYERIQTEMMRTEPIPLTAYVLITLYEVTDTSEEALQCMETTRSRAASYLANQINDIPETEVFWLAISAYALSLSQEKSRTAFNRLWAVRRSGEETYFADREIPQNPSEIINTVRFLQARQELMNDGYGVQATAYALMAHINNMNDVDKTDRDALMRWLQTMRNSIGGFASTQDTLVAMEALFKFTQVDPNRNVFDMMMQLESTASPNWKNVTFFNKFNYTTLAEAFLPTVWGAVKVLTQGTGRALMQLTTTVHVEYPWLVKTTQDEIQFFELFIDEMKWHGRNFSVMQMTTCASWVYTELSLTSGMAVMEIDIPTGYIVMNDTLRRYVQSGQVPNLKRAESYGRKVVFYFNYMDQTRSCVTFRADRWYPVANATIQHRMRIYDYYEPGMHNTTMYTTYNLFNLNTCFVCGSYQCPYCPSFNLATVLRASISLLTVILGVLVRRYVLDG